MAKKNYWVAAFALVLMAAAGWWWVKLYPVERVKKQVSVALNDPESAKFQEVIFYPKTGAGCGYVNARNKMGGYVGFTLFMALEDGAVSFLPEASSVGDASEQLAALDKKIDWLKIAAKNCPEESAKP